MSGYRQSPSKSPYKSIVRSIIDERHLVEDEIALKKGIAMEAEHRRLLDEVSILRLKLRKTEDLEIKHEGLLKQIALLSADNDRLLVEINERKMETDRLKLTYAQVHDRENFKVTKLSEQTNLLKLEYQDLQREKNENSKMYEGHINSLQILLQEKIKELDITSMKFNKLISEKETKEIRFEEELMRLKSEMGRAEFAREREVEQDKERRYAERLQEIENMKRNHQSQIALLEDEVRKLAKLSQLKSADLDGQIYQNRQLKAAQEGDLRDLMEQNDALRLRMAKLEQHNRSQIQSIETKYSNIQAEGTISLKEQHGNEIRLLLSQLDKQKWLLGEKNIEIQQLTSEKRDLKQSSEEYQLQLTSEISLLKSKLISQQDKYSEDKHSQLGKINALEERILRESESYHERVRQFTNKIEELQGDLRNKEVAYDRVKKELDLQREQLLKEKEELRQELASARILLGGNESQLIEEKERAEEYRKKSQLEYQRLAREISVLKQENETLEDGLESLRESSGNEQVLLQQENQSLKRTNSKLEDQMNEFQAKSTEELGDLSEAHRTEVKRIEGILALKLQQTTRSYQQQRGNLEVELALAKKYAADKDQELRNLLQKFEELNVHFDNREQLIQFVPKSDASILEAFSQQKHQSEFRVYDR